MATKKFLLGLKNVFFRFVLPSSQHQISKTPKLHIKTTKPDCLVRTNFEGCSAASLSQEEKKYFFPIQVGKIGAKFFVCFLHTRNIRQVLSRCLGRCYLFHLWKIKRQINFSHQREIQYRK